MSENKMDISKVLAILSQPKETPAPLTNIERIILQVPYITKDEKIEIRTVKVILPKGISKPMPLIYIPHYEMGEDALELRDYLAKGWAVACPADFDDSYNGKLTDDDLVFNNAALYTLRHRSEFDKGRIILVGGSAGGYMTMMLNGLHLGLCASIANGPITNAYFNFKYYFQKANTLNLQALKKTASENARNEDGEMNQETVDSEMKGKDQAALALLQNLKNLPLPFLAGLMGIFNPVLSNFPDQEDYDRWEALSAVGIADCFCSPIMINHCTSDVLVPVDQITKKFTYSKPGDSLPETFDARLPNDFPGKLKYSLEECLPEKNTKVMHHFVPVQAQEESVLPFDISKQFNINIFDDGPIEGYGTHSSRMDVGRRLDTPYLEEMFKKTASENCILTPAMLKSMIVRYQGKSIALPAHSGMDDTVYGSLNIYQKEICEELADWRTHHGSDVLKDKFENLLENETESKEKEDLITSMNEILHRIEV